MPNEMIPEMIAGIEARVRLLKERIAAADLGGNRQLKDLREELALLMRQLDRLTAANHD